MSIELAQTIVMGWPVAICRHCDRAITQTQPYADGWVHRLTERERCDPMYPQSSTATPRA